MRLLVISHNPDRASFRERIGRYLPKLEAEGVECRVEKLPCCEFKRYSLFKSAKEFDGVLLHKKRLNWFDCFWLKKFSKNVIYDFDDAVMFDEKRPGALSGKRMKDFARTAKLAAEIIAGNDYLCERAKKFNSNVTVIPTGIDIQKYDVKVTRDDDKVRLVWIGSKSTLGYLTEMKDVLEDIGKGNDNVVLRIICDEFFELENMAVEKCQWGIDSQYGELATSDIGLAPLPDNNFTRGKCGFKILQYQAAGIAVVAAGVGVNKDIVSDGANGFVADSAEQWHGKIEKLIGDAELRRQMGGQGKKDVQQYDTNAVGGKFVTTIKNVLECD